MYDYNHTAVAIEPLSPFESKCICVCSNRLFFFALVLKQAGVSCANVHIGVKKN